MRFGKFCDESVLALATNVFSFESSRISGTTPFVLFTMRTLYLEFLALRTGCVGRWNISASLLGTTCGGSDADRLRR